MKLLALRICAFRILIDIATLLSKEVVRIYTINLSVVFYMCSVSAGAIPADSLFSYYCDSTLHSAQG